MEVNSPLAESKETFLGSKSLFGCNDSTRTSRCSLYNVIEADYLQGWDFQESNGDDKSISNHINPALLDLDHNSCHSTFYDILEEELDENSVEILKKKLSGVLSRDCMIRDRLCRLLVPMDLIRRISADVVRMSQLEPRGVDGGRLKVKLDFDGCETDLGQVCSSNSTTSTNDDNNNNNEILYEINLTLKEDSKNWPSFKQLAFMLPSIVCCRLSQPRQTMVYVGQGYKLEKVKLYKNTNNSLNSPNFFYSNVYLNNNNINRKSVLNNNLVNGNNNINNNNSNDDDNNNNNNNNVTAVNVNNNNEISNNGVDLIVTKN